MQSERTKYVRSLFKASRELSFHILSQRLSREVGRWSQLKSAPNIIRLIGYVVEESEGAVHASLITQWYENRDLVRYLVMHKDADREQLVSFILVPFCIWC